MHNGTEMLLFVWAFIFLVNGCIMPESSMSDIRMDYFESPRLRDLPGKLEVDLLIYTIASSE